MAVEDFDTFITSIGATTAQEVKSTQPMYQYGTYMFHFISLKNYPTNNPEYLITLIHEAEAKGQKLIHIWEDLWLHKKHIIQGRIRALLGKSHRLHGRQTIIKRIDKNTAHRFLETHHLQGATSAYYKFGLYNKEELVAVATFSKSRIMHDGPNYYRSYELERFASKTGYTVTGALSKLLSFFITTHEPAHLMTYADREWGAGEGYSKLGFSRTGETSPHLFWVDKITLKRIKTAEASQSQAYYYAIYNAGSIKFVLDRRKQ